MFVIAFLAVLTMLVERKEILLDRSFGSKKQSFHVCEHQDSNDRTCDAGAETPQIPEIRLAGSNESLPISLQKSESLQDAQPQTPSGRVIPSSHYPPPMYPHYGFSPTHVLPHAPYYPMPPGSSTGVPSEDDAVTSKTPKKTPLVQVTPNRKDASHDSSEAKNGSEHDHSPPPPLPLPHPCYALYHPWPYPSATSNPYHPVYGGPYPPYAPPLMYPPGHPQLNNHNNVKESIQNSAPSSVDTSPATERTTPKGLSSSAMDVQTATQSLLHGAESTISEDYSPSTQISENKITELRCFAA